MKKKFKVDIEYDVIKTLKISKTIQADSHEEAEIEAKKYINDDCRIISIESKYVPYKTERWQEIEDLIFSYDESISEAESEGEDEDYIESLRCDKSDWEYILEQLVQKEFEKTAERYSNLDTCVRERVPDGLYEFWDNFDFEAYEKYLDEKEKWRIEKMKKEN